MDLDYTRHYYGHKVAKDFILHTKKYNFTQSEIKSYFDKNMLLNYMNDLQLNIIDNYLYMRDESDKMIYDKSKVLDKEHAKK